MDHAGATNVHVLTIHAHAGAGDLQEYADPISIH
jgi:hypothetical protein